ncbi:putative protein OS=Streptomyces aurantiogriseus OX=66870 GN=GCM10010251_10160 PE=4 SV=1 [Streptomyces aurantiogriseus]|uniref:Uncharacterized protein n=1 Tax=Streptomyces aurantiogriseus TaxID=66870 RepID=A0A918BYL4_9ACTN|nr:hypothetical protein GCM10010251_10160 [Streptomyces aurantiogriseus]
MLTVPGQAACSCEQAMVTGGRRCTGYAAAISRAMAHATSVSVANGRYGPCCSKLPTGRTATCVETPAPRVRTSSVVSFGNSPYAADRMSEPLIFSRPFVSA